MRSKLLAIQTELKAPKNQYNKFGQYNYRSCEDILEAVKPLIKKYNCCLTLHDEIIEVGGRIYVKAIARIEDNEKGSDCTVQCSAFAREAEVQKGMSEPQITGSASSYARKYALNGLFLIDDTKDDDATNKHGKESSELQPKKKGNYLQAEKAIKAAISLRQIQKFEKIAAELDWTEDEFTGLSTLINDRKIELEDKK